VSCTIVAAAVVDDDDALLHAFLLSVWSPTRAAAAAGPTDRSSQPFYLADAVANCGIPNCRNLRSRG
jgi:hypothetical protein